MPDQARNEAGEEPLTPSSGDSGSDTPTVGVVGTLAYMSPEQGDARRDLVGLRATSSAWARCYTRS